ncbi:hypothetical protein [Amycolatopsis dongchuanensis]|uniref:Excreted virulence factor EspC, type VII ESX diderm n=1 Tax=Amycolatopsis dongchuanensis TaxID=1070866 RepID=A0ABP8VDQ4_9PSEU
MTGNSGPGFYADPEGIKGIAKRLSDAAEAMRANADEMVLDCMFGTANEAGTTSGPCSVFGARTPGGARLGQKFDDLIGELASYGRALAGSMSTAADQLSRTGDIYVQTDSDVSGN